MPPSFQETIAMKAKKKTKDKKQVDSGEVEKNVRERGIFANGVAVGLGMAYIAAFAILWASVYFSPRMPTGISYEDLLSIFFYPLIILLAVGTVSLTAGIVRQYYAEKRA